MESNWDELYQDKYKLPEHLIRKAARFSEFAMGGAQITVKLRNGNEVHEALLSNCTYIVAVRGYDALPFKITDVADVYQTSEDEGNRDRAKWITWK